MVICLRLPLQNGVGDKIPSPFNVPSVASVPMMRRTSLMTSERDFNISGVYKENVFQLKDWVSRYAPLISDWSLEKRKICINDSLDGPLSCVFKAELEKCYPGWNQDIHMLPYVIFLIFSCMYVGRSH